MSDRKKIYFKLFSGGKYDTDSPPESLLELIGWLQKWLDQVPAEFRQNATMEISTDDGCLEIEVRWWRLETDEEYNARVTRETEQARVYAGQQQVRELQLLAFLKHKYE